jgi:hypothetical protein
MPLRILNGPLWPMDFEDVNFNVVVLVVDVVVHQTEAPFLVVVVVDVRLFACLFFLLDS